MRPIRSSLLCAFLLALLQLSASAVSPLWKSLGPDGGDFMFSKTDESNSSNIIAATQSPSAVFRTFDAGRSWSRLKDFPSSLNDMEAPSFQRLYAVDYYTLYRSSDSGETWTSIEFPDYFYAGAVRSPAQNPSLVYVAGFQYDYHTGAYQFALCKSTDAGGTWTSSTLSSSCQYLWVVDLAVSESNPQVLFACGEIYTGTTDKPFIFKSSNGGALWSDITGSVPAGTSYSFSFVQIDPKDPARLFLGGQYLYRSTDGGDSWGSLSSISYPQKLAFSSYDSANVFLATSSQLYCSNNHGGDWNKTSAFKGYARDLRFALNNLTLGTNCGLYRSGDAVTWTPIHNGLRGSSISLVQCVASKPNNLWTLTNDSTLYTSANSGESWRVVEYPADCGSIRDFSIHRTNPDQIVVLGPGG